MKLKIGEDGHAILQDGKPVYVHDDGKEIAFDAAGTVATISRLNGEAKGHRTKAEELAAQLKNFEGLDPAAARKALETVSALDAKQLIDAGQVDQIKAEAQKAFDEKLKAIEASHAPVAAERDSLAARLNGMIVSNAFDRSKFIADKIAVPVDMIQNTFGRNFKIEDGALVGYDASGNKLFSRARPGEVATFDEALELMVEAYPHRDSILKGTGATGGGASGSGGATGNPKIMTRAAVEKLNPAERMAFFKSGGKTVDQ